MNGWRIAFEYYRKKGFPEDLLLNQSITQDDADQLVKLLSRIKPSAVLEIGTFIGISTVSLALASNGNFKIICVDPNLPVNIQSSEFDFYESRGSMDILKETLRQLGLARNVIFNEGFYSCYPSKKFQQHISSYNIDASKINIVGFNVQQFAPFEMVFLDGDHYSEAVKSDLDLIHKQLSPNGVIILHDFSGDWAKQVSMGVDAFLNDHPEYILSVEGNLGLVQQRNI